MAKTLRNAKPEDAAAICEVYNPYILTTAFTFEEEPVPVSGMIDRLAQVQTAHLPWLVLEEDHHLKGYAYASPWKARSAYRFTVETSIYIHSTDRQRGLGLELYQTLLQTLHTQGIHSVIGILALPNPSSVRLHEKLGFECVGHLKDAGFKFDRWIDVAYWQKIL